ncbi:hypothetical protein [Stutzerimonas nitrititolerans]|uniref:Uncharacterized protein n=1 Tax=Stutzerimonas nitrititolerans TaxID=2482751 RepID=A0AA41WP37_9GAMM|nr:hypothetical protein [Stutzerimonas nitrititolerans]MCO7546128.1 hypothetical protein [Stutzerimonas nitrititolerans]
MQHTDKARAEFEAAYMRDLAGSSAEDPAVWLERGSDGEYRSYQARGAWWGWQASRRELVIRLPAKPDADTFTRVQSAYWQGIDKVAGQAEAAGATVRG